MAHLKKVHSYFIQKKQNLTERREKFRKKLKSNHMLYALVGGTGVVLFWHGIWEGLNEIYLTYGQTSVLGYIGHPLSSLIMGTIILSISGLFVGELIGKIDDAKEKAEQLMQEEEHLEVKQEKLEESQDALQDAIEEDHEELAAEIVTARNSASSQIEDMELERSED